MNFLIGLIFFFSNILAVNSEFVTLSDKAEIGLLTCAPGNELYSTFGHSALHLYDPQNEIDIVYNYGMFSFNTNNFYYKFVKGETDYKLGKQQFERFLREYNWFGRNVYEHKLDLTQNELQTLFEALETNYLPKNRVYRYSYMLDNCSSRLRDMFNTVFKENISWQGQANDSIIPQSYPFYDVLEDFYNKEIELTYRDILDIYLLPSPWADFAIDLCIGAPADKPADLHGSMFIPDFLMNATCHAQISRDSTIKPLIKSIDLKTEFYDNPLHSNDITFSHPIMLLWSFFFLIVFITIAEFFYKKHLKWLDSIIFGLIGLFAIVVWFVSFISVHPAVFPNYNVIWLLPTHFIYAIMIYFTVFKRITILYNYSILIITIVFFLIWPILPQSMNLTNIPIILLPFMRILKIVIAEKLAANSKNEC